MKVQAVFLLRTLSLILIISILKCSNPTEPDKTPPSIVITNPVNGATVSEIVTITAVASDNEGIKKVVLFIDGYQLDGVEDNTEPFELRWNTSTYPDSSQHTILTRAFDKKDNLKDSDPIILTVNNAASRPKRINLNPIKYENLSFVLSWSPSIDGDFDFYRLYESLFDDMSNEGPIFTSNIRTDTNYTVTNINENEERFYRLTITDTLGLETSSLIKGGIASLITTEGLEGYFPFNGNANDESGNGFHGSVHGATLVTDRLGVESSAYYFDGVDDYVDVGDRQAIRILGNLTISLWIRPDSFYGIAPGIISCVADNTDNPQTNALYRLYFRDNMGSLYYEHESGSGTDHFYKFSEFTFETDQWYHIAIVRNANTKTVGLYVNGNYIETYTYTENPDNGDLATLRIGEHHGTVKSSRFFGGAIDEILIFTRCLSDADIQFLYFAKSAFD